MKSNKLKREPKYIAKFKAFPYQQEAVDAVKDLEYAAIFHEQGLGKTKIAIDVLLYWLSECSMDTALIVTKKQLVANWVRGIAEYNVELRTDRTVIDICKPYKNKILADRIRKINDSISDINFVPFYSGEKVTAMLWYAETNFLGTVLDKDIKGIRIRQGNILIGDENTLRKCYKEERFNSWMVGELLVFNEDIIPNTRRDDYEKNSAYKELLSQFTEWANEMSRQIRHRSYERSLTQSDKKFLADESVTDVDGVDISLGTELDSYDMDDSDSVANTDLLSKLSLLMDMGKKKTKYNVLNLNSKFTVDQKQTLEHVFDALYAKYTNAKANDIIQTIIDSF